MVHKKYTYRNGKRYGPYYYENKRVGDKVITTYLGSKPPKKNVGETGGSKVWSVLVLIFIGLVIFSFVYTGITGRNVTEILDEVVEEPAEVEEVVEAEQIEDIDNGDEDEAVEEPEPEPEPTPEPVVEEELIEGPEVVEAEGAVEEGESGEVVAGEVESGNESEEGGVVDISVIEDNQTEVEEQNDSFDVEVNDTEIAEENVSLNDSVEPVEEPVIETNDSVVEVETPIVEENETIVEANISEVNDTEPINTSIVDVGNVSVKVVTSRGRIRVGERVKWVKNVSLSEPENVSVELPEIAEEVVVKKVEKGVEKSANSRVKSITGGIIRDGELDVSEIVAWLKRVFRVTGLAVAEEGNASVEVVLEDEAVEYIIEYYTEAPQAFEEVIERGKRVVISGPDEVEYTDVVAFADVSEGKRIRLYWVDGAQDVEFDGFDSDGNGLVDYIEWVVPHLSNQTYEVIFITGAEHLDSNREFVSDIYAEVQHLDGVWSEEIPSGDYVRVVFEENLTAESDITIYPRKVTGSPRIEIYEKNGSEVIAEIDPLVSEEFNKAYLTNLSGEQDSFDLLILGGRVEFDYIVDPFSAHLVSSCAAHDIAAKGSFGDACDVVDGSSLELNDGVLETHTYKKGNKYAGIEIESVNTSVNCDAINSVEICYEWWVTSTPDDCDVSVDADAGANYTAATTTCPGTSADPGVVCIDVTGLEAWSCSNFFGASGTRASAKSEVHRTTGNPTETSSWDVLYFNVSFNESDLTPPASVTNLDNQSATATSIFWNWTNPLDADFNVSMVFIDSINVANTSNNFYNATGFSPNTTHTITIHTKDNSGNVNDTDVNDTATTLASLAPVINSITDDPDPVVSGANINISADVTKGDNNISSVFAEIEGTNYTMIQQPVGGNGPSNEVFSDDFNRYVGDGESIANDWEEDPVGGWSSSDANAPDCFDDADDDCAEFAGTGNIPNNITHNLSTVGSVNVSIKTHSRCIGHDAGTDFLRLDAFNGSGWTTVYDSDVDGGCPSVASGELPQVNLTSDFWDNAAVRIKYLCSVGGGSEACYVDNVNVSGYVKIVGDPAIWNVSINTSVFSQGVHNYTVNVNDTLNNFAIPLSGNFTISDTIPPASVTDLDNQSASITSIFWNWTNPLDVDFDEAIIFIDSVNVANTSNNFYNATGLSPGTNHTITVHTKDNDGNVNNTDVNDTASTLPSADLPPTSDSPSDQAVNLGDDASIIWTLQDDVAPGFYAVEKDGSSFVDTTAWVNNTPNIVIPNTFFLGSSNYTILYNDSIGLQGVPDEVNVTVTSNLTLDCGVIDKPIVLKNITIDGDFIDWGSVLLNTENHFTDEVAGFGDPDNAGTADRDLTDFAFTFNDDSLFVYYRRINKGSNVLAALLYLDYDNDGFMNDTDQVLHISWSGGGGTYDTSLYDYTPAVAAGDLMEGDGHNLNGTILLNTSLDSNVPGGSDSGIQVEVSVDWSDLGLSGAEAITFQPASAKGGGTNLPSQLEDNINVTTNGFSLIILEPNRTKGTSPGTSVFYDHSLLNCGLSGGVIEFTNISSEEFNLTLFHANGTAIEDADADGDPDIFLDQDNFTTLIVRIDVPDSASTGTVDITTITASFEAGGSNASVVDTTTIGDITISPISRVLGATPGVTAFTTYTISNFQGFSDTIEVNAVSSEGYNFTLHFANGTILTDTDSDNSTDVGSLLASESVDILVNLEIPIGASPGDVDSTTITINSSFDPSLTTNSLMNTSVDERLTITEDENRSVGIGSATFYALDITNNFNESEVVELTYTFDLNYDTDFFEDDLTTLLVDSNFDNNVDITVGGLGGVETIFVRVIVPGNATEGDNETTTVFANASTAPTIFDSAILITTARVVVTYDSALRSTEEVTFEVGDGVFARSYGLGSVNNVFYDWIDPNNTVIKTSASIPVTSEDTADDELFTNETLLLGNWTVVVFDAQSSVELGRNIFFLVDTEPPQVFDLAPVNGTRFNASDIIEIGANVTDYFIGVVFANITQPNGTIVSLALTNQSEDRYNETFVVPIETGTYSVQFFANDSSGNVNATETTFFIFNTPPTDPTPELNSTDGSNRTLQDLHCFDTLLDGDGNYLNVTLKWYNESILHLSESVNSSFANGTLFDGVLGFGNTTKGQNWTCGLQLHDGTEFSEEVNSSVLQILNSPPNVVLLTPPDGTNTTDRTPNFTWSGFDADNDPITFELNVSLVGASTCFEPDRHITGITAESHELVSELQCFFDNGDVYNWSVRADDGEVTGAYAEAFRINISSEIVISLPVDFIDFGIIALDSTNDTTSDDPPPFTLQNDGTVIVNVTIEALNLWATESNPSSSYQFKIDDFVAENNSFNSALSVLNFTDMPANGSAILAIAELNHTNATDIAEIDINISVPVGETLGQKSSTVTFTASLGEG